MVATLAAAMLVALGGASQRQTDTTFAVPAGASLSVNNFGGGITIHGWSENRVKVHAEQGRRGRVEVSLVGNTVVIKASSREGAPSVMDFDITVPQSMELTLSGTYADINVDGMQGPISAETVNGEVNVRGGKGNITLHSIQGTVTLADASGRIEVNSVNEDIELTNVSGEIKVETTNTTRTKMRTTAIPIPACTSTLAASPRTQRNTQQHTHPCTRRDMQRSTPPDTRANTREPTVGHTRTPTSGSVRPSTNRGDSMRTVLIASALSLGALTSATAQDFNWHGRLAAGKRLEVKGVNG